MQKLVWRVKLIADFGDEATETEVEVARIERADFAAPETLGLSLAERKRLTAAIQLEMVRAQAATMGERFLCCAHCGSTLSSKGFRPVTFRSLFGDVPLRVRRFVSCQCREIADEPRSLSALSLEGGMSPELAYLTLPATKNGCSLVTCSVSRRPSGPSSVRCTTLGAVRRNSSRAGRQPTSPVKPSHAVTRSPIAISSIGVPASKDEKPEGEHADDGAGLRVGGCGFFTAFTAQDDISVTRS